VGICRWRSWWFPSLAVCLGATAQSPLVGEARGAHPGVLAVIQFFIAVDVLASLMVMSAVSLGILAAVYHRQVTQRGRRCCPRLPTRQSWCAAARGAAYYLLAGPGSLPVAAADHDP